MWRNLELSYKVKKIKRECGRKKLVQKVVNNRLKREINLNYIWKVSSYLSRNTERRYFDAQIINAVYGD